MSGRSIPGAHRCAMMGVSTQGAGVDSMPLGGFDATGSGIEEETKVLAIQGFQMAILPRDDEWPFWMAGLVG